MDKHRSIVFTSKNKKPNGLNNQNQNQNQPLLKKANIIINTSFFDRNNNNNNNDENNGMKCRAKSAAPRIMLRHNNIDDTYTRYKLMTSNNNNTRPNTAKSTSSQIIGPTSLSSSSSSVGISNINLTLNIPNRQPNLLERYWKYNKIKKSEVLTNRCFDSDEGRLYVLCTASYLQNIPKLIRQKPKVGLEKQITTVTFSNFNETKKLDLPESDNNSTASTIYYYTNSIGKANSYKSDKDAILPMKSSLKNNKNRRCVSATPILERNNINKTIKKSKQNINDEASSTTTITNTNNNINNNEDYLSETLTLDSLNQDNLKERLKQEIKEINSDYYYTESEIDSKASEIQIEKSNNNNNNNITDITNKNIQRSLTSTTEKSTSTLRPKSSFSTTSTMTNETYKKYNTVSKFNTFKNKLIDRKVYNQKQYENLDQVFNNWLHKPIPQDKKYVAGKYSLEMKRINYANFIKKRQLYLSESLCIKKLNVNIE